MSNLFISPKLVASICKNGKTLQVLNLNHSFIFESNEESGYRHTVDVLYNVAKSKFQEIIKCCQQLKEIDLNYINEEEGRRNQGILKNRFYLFLDFIFIFNFHRRVVLCKAEQIHKMTLKIVLDE